MSLQRCWGPGKHDLVCQAGEVAKAGEGLVLETILMKAVWRPGPTTQWEKEETWNQLTSTS